MAKGTSRPMGSGGEYISHINAIRMRVVGNGNLKLTLTSFQDVHNQDLVDISLSEKTNIQPMRLANFVEQRAALTIKTTSINDYFRVNRIIVFTKFFASEYPA